MKKLLLKLALVLIALSPQQTTASVVNAESIEQKSTVAIESKSNEIILVASGTRKISTSDAQGLNGRTIELPIHSGYDLTIDFLELNEIIVDATPGDPSSFVFNGLVGNLCPTFVPVECKGNGARLIRIRQIKPIEFENITSSQDGKTSLTLVTTGSEGYKVYKFILKKASGTPSFNHLKITHDLEKIPQSESEFSQFNGYSKFSRSSIRITEEDLEKARERWNKSKLDNCEEKKDVRVAQTLQEREDKSCDRQ